MSTIKNLFVSLIYSVVAAAATVFGMLAAGAIWDNGLGDKVAAKTRKLFKTKK